MTNYFNQQKIKYLQRIIYTSGESYFVEYPWRSTLSIWHAIVAEIMLQRTKVDQVLPVYNNFVQRFPLPADFLQFNQHRKENVFSSLGLIWRMEILVKATEYYVNNGPPKTYQSLLSYPGVGDYIAAAVASFHLNERALLIDSNIVRLFCRFFGVVYNNETRRQIWLRELSDQITPQKVFKKFNYAVLDFSMSVCKINPNCPICPTKRKCSFRNEKTKLK